MPGDLGPQDIDDIALNCFESPLHRGKYTDISFTRQNNMVRRFMKKGKLPEKSGPNCTFRAMTSFASTSRVTGMYAQDRRGRKTMTKKGSVKWCKIDAEGEYDIDDETFQTGDNVEIINFFRMLRHGVYSDINIKKEELMFNMPQSAEETPWPITGLPYWFPLDTTYDGDDGVFRGMNPAGHSATGGLDRTTIPGWRSFTFGFDDCGWKFFEQIRNAFFFTHFENPDEKWKDEANFGTNREWFMCSTLSVKNEAANTLRTGNQNFGTDVTNFGNVLINNKGLEASAYLTENSENDDLYAVNTRFTGWYGQKGGSMRESKPTVIPGASDMRMFRLADWSQMICENSREGGFRAGRRTS